MVLNPSQYGEELVARTQRSVEVYGKYARNEIFIKELDSSLEEHPRVLGREEGSKPLQPCVLWNIADETTGKRHLVREDATDIRRTDHDDESVSVPEVGLGKIKVGRA